MTDQQTAELGDRVRDQITGFEGIVTGRVRYISGCDQVLVAPRVGEDGNARRSEWYDVDRCEVLDRAVVRIESVSSSARPGSDRPAPRR